jgi:uncharacterized membrane protein YkoI
VEIDGVLKPKIKLSDVKMDNVRSIAVYKGAAQQKMYPDGETKGYDGLIAIKTSEGSKGSGAINATILSEDNAGQNQAMQDAGGRTLVEIDGVLKPNMRPSDVKMDNVISIEVLKGKAMQKRYPNGEAKDYDGLIAIKTFKGMKSSQIKGSGAVNSTTFSKEESKHTFSEDNAGQSQARSTLDAAQFLEENYVVVFNGKFVPKIDLLEDRDTYIQEVNIYKGDALKKFPKRKVKGYDVVIEVITN